MINVTLIPALSDNYIYLLEADNGEVAVVDPGDAAPVIEALEANNLKPAVILITHHHWDHIQGLDDLLKHAPCSVAGPASETARIKPMDILLDEASDFSFGGERVQIIETPGHTSGHICFYFSESGFALTADTLFAMGCGRLFEGTPAQMWNSLQKLAALPDDTKIYCGHEYTLSNAEFCAGIEPENEALQKRLQNVRGLRADNMPTIPTTIALEKQTNAFLRAGSLEKFTEIRTAKDNA